MFTATRPDTTWWGERTREPLRAMARVKRLWDRRRRQPSGQGERRVRATGLQRRFAARPVRAPGLQPRDEEFALEDEFFGEVGVDFYKELVLGDDFFAPFFGVDVLESFESLVG